MIKPWIKRIEELRSSRIYIEPEDIQNAILDEISELHQEIKNLLMSNLDCVIQFNTLKSDYDLLTKEISELERDYADQVLLKIELHEELVKTKAKM